ncbi:hypothetical protein DFP72DRAFT_1073020 [Ephemerocybe angulata]|uniref:NACHT domain-containing protein n=1 Tax=Ephemerocybe angulata TaxID=980116 RepID=A0A8H6M2F4_9AGAR|nr:hypothetical protein DFP72DRAFT_1073020 [Tulosesus angulatus]
MSQYFDNAHEFSIGEMTINHSSQHNHGLQSGIQKLAEHIAAGASHDSRERYPPPKCYPGTQDVILESVTSWFRHRAEGNPILWLHGPTGMGKTTVAQTIAEQIETERQLAAAFFFSRSSADRSDSSQFVASLASQMAPRIPGMLARVEQAVQRNPFIFTKAPSIQLEQLVIEPCKALNLQGLSRQLIIIDGLDECIGSADSDREHEQEIVLNLILALVTSTLPLGVLLCSRAEEWLKAAFEDEPFSKMTDLLSLGWTSKADEDIWHYFTKEFERICARPRNRDAMRSVEKPWPPLPVYRALVQRSSGQYVFAATAIRFIDDRWSVPQKQLERLMRSLSDPGEGATIFSPVDRLYLDIMRSCPNTDLMLQVLGEVICLDYTIKVSDRWDVLDALFQRTPGESCQALRGLHSVVDVDNVKWSEKLPLFHASFLDFISSPERAGPFSIDMALVHSRLLHKCIDRLELSVPPSSGIGHRNSHKYASNAWRSPHLSDAAITEDLLIRLSSFNFQLYWSSVTTTNPDRLTTLMEWVWGHGLFSVRQMEAIPHKLRVNAQTCAASFQSSYDEAIVLLLDQEALKNDDCLERMLDACFSEDLRDLGIVAAPDKGGSYYASITFMGEIPPAALCDSYIGYWSFNAAPNLVPAHILYNTLRYLEDGNEWRGRRQGHVNKDMELLPIRRVNYGVHFHVFLPAFLGFIADTKRSKHHCYVTQDRIRWIIRRMLEHPTGLSEVVLTVDKHQDVRTLEYPFAQWYASY